MFSRRMGYTTPAGTCFSASMWVTVPRTKDALLRSAVTMSILASEKDSFRTTNVTVLNTATVAMNENVVHGVGQSLSADTL